LLAQNVWAQPTSYLLAHSFQHFCVASSSFLPAWTSTPTARSTARKGPKGAPGRATNKGKGSEGACTDYGGKLGAEPYGVTWALANSTPCLVIATARYSYIDSYIDSFIVENDIVETMVMGSHTNYYGQALAVVRSRRAWQLTLAVVAIGPGNAKARGNT
jgi:hypothetical protein